VLAKPLSTIYQRSWLSGEVPEDWRLANVTPIYKKGRKDDLGNYRPVSLTLVPGEDTAQIILGEITWHVRGIQGIRPSQHGFMKGKSCLTKLISFYDLHCLMHGLRCERSKLFSTNSHITYIHSQVSFYFSFPIRPYNFPIHLYISTEYSTNTP